MKSVDEIEDYLSQFVPVVSKTTGKNVTTERTQLLAEHFGNPQDKLRVVHVAGTSGKTSTCYYLSTLLCTTGARVGLTVSPHIDTLTERVQVNGNPLTDRKFINYFSEFIVQLNSFNGTPSYYEIMIVFALWVFEKEKVDYAVVETGLGGLHDSTNICTKSDKICVITDISFDHMQVLGSTIVEIATQKAGIIWPNNEVFSYFQSEDAMDVIKRATATAEGTLHIVSDTGRSGSSMALFQKRNWHLAHTVFEHIKRTYNLTLPSQSVVEATQSISIPGRMEMHKISNQTWVIDGAHNEQKLRAFLESYQEKFPGRKPTVILALKVGKELDPVAQIIATQASHVVATTFSLEQDMPMGAQSPETIMAALKMHGCRNVTVEQRLEDALSEALNSGTKDVLVIGSLFLAGETRRLLRNAQLI